MDVPQKIIQMACNKICNKFRGKKNKNTPRFKKINTQFEYAEFIRTEGNGSYSKGIKKVCTELVGYRILLESDGGQEDASRLAILNLTNKFLADIGSIDPSLPANGLRNLPALMNLHYQGKWKPEILKSEPEKKGDNHN